MREDVKYQQLLDKMKAIETFISGFSFLSCGRDFISCRKWSFSLQAIITSIELTAGNIITCCEYACIVDANTLLRKYRDDLMFYLYIIVYDINKNWKYNTILRSRKVLYQVGYKMV